MNLNYKLFFKYIIFNSKQIFIKYLNRSDKNLIVYTSVNTIYYLTLHIKLSSLFYSTQLIDMFTYESPNIKNHPNMDFKNKINSNTTTSIVYNFHSILNQQRFLIICTDLKLKNYKKLTNNKTLLTSITEIFQNANWLERENAELHGIFFLGKKDVRNLMLVYGETNSPMKKSFPSIGIKEIFYDVTIDSLIQTPVSIQF